MVIERILNTRQSLLGRLMLFFSQEWVNIFINAIFSLGLEFVAFLPGLNWGNLGSRLWRGSSGIQSETCIHSASRTLFKACAVMASLHRVLRGFIWSNLMDAWQIWEHWQKNSTSKICAEIFSLVLFLCRYPPQAHMTPCLDTRVRSRIQKLSVCGILWPCLSVIKVIIRDANDWRLSSLTYCVQGVPEISSQSESTSHL